ncbi:MAG: tRNA(5-methylaminomethyl-2-thiouridylate) methyltransferase [Desulfovibrio sp.]|jgi:uncharacterized protein with PIN domain|nr:tRNA(5-methylaminomethyl-2-thiouridylate) methyltransferase [Desulfovibrio sp.]
MERKRYDAVALLSGGLDSILAVKVIEEQGLAVKCLHFVSPFFGKPGKVKHWEAIYGLDIAAVDLGESFATLLRERPAHGFGKVLNPCVDCKIIMISRAREMMERYGASFIITGEVLGQRPMSQRRDTLNVIRRDAGVKELLLRPLCARKLDPTPAEESGLVDRSRLHAIFGRGRKEQMALAEKYGLTEIPTPAGGCKLAERENARRYWPVLAHSPLATAAEFKLANIGRQYWAGPHWLSIGRHQADNDALVRFAFPADLHFKVAGFPGPLAIGRQFDGKAWDEEVVRDAAAFVASFSPKAVREGTPVTVRVAGPDGMDEVTVTPARTTPLGWGELNWQGVREEIRADARARALPVPEGNDDGPDGQSE